MRSLPRLTFLLLAMTVALGGCGKKSDTPPPAAQRDPQQAQTDQGGQEPAADAAEPKLPKVDFVKPALALAAGSYGGACVNSDATKSNVTISVTPDGKLKMGDLSGTVTDKIMLSKHREGAKLWYTLLVSGEQANVSMMRHMDAAEHQVSATVGAVGVSCNTATKVLPLEGKTVFSAYADVLRTQPRKLRCMVMSDMTFKELPFELQDDKLTLGDQVVDLSKVTTETLSAEGNGAGYIFVEGDQRRGTVSVDEFGRLHAVSVTAGDKGYNCTDLASAGN